MCKNAVQKLPFVKRYDPDQYKTQEMCDKGIVESCGTLKFVPDCYKYQKMCNRAADTYSSAIQFVRC